jgi:hypothetical protein
MVNPKPKRRWCQFSLLSLLVVTTVGTVTFGGWVQYRRQRAEENRDRVATAEQAIEKTVAAIEDMRGEATSEYEELRPQTWLEEQFDDPGGPDDLVGVRKVTEVNLIHRVTDAGREFVHFNFNVGDAGLEQLEGLTDLEILNLFGTNVSDAGLEHLQGSTNLQHLNLNGTDVSDAGLEHLKGLKNLQALGLFATKVTDEGVKKLQQALPNCKISR